MDDDFLSKLLNSQNYLTQRDSADHPAVNCPAERWLDCATSLKEEHGFDLLSDATCIDWDKESPRFSAVYHLFSTTTHNYIRIVVDALDDENPSVPSVTSLWDAANWHEREAYDMFGVSFENHPDLRRILMWDSYPWHPLRKEFPLAGHETDLPDLEVSEETGTPVIPAPMAGGPFVSSQQVGMMSKNEPRGADQSWNEEEEKR
ncbi:MAG: NADH-quinone oxidoreductase subunit C [Verrucomicrobia bacterium]|nr:NADH-quinone oxidoreductase subunit C [Verrucomicrobiota bacterium]MDA1067550.1 NADH-quinone oxidoreductase subunit C [Verrucomicrobiota bacterium]